MKPVSIYCDCVLFLIPSPRPEGNSEDISENMRQRATLLGLELDGEWEMKEAYVCCRSSADRASRTSAQIVSAESAEDIEELPLPIDPEFVFLTCHETGCDYLILVAPLKQLNAALPGIRRRFQLRDRIEPLTSALEMRTVLVDLPI